MVIDRADLPPQAAVVFGATGDLSRRKLLPETAAWLDTLGVKRTVLATKIDKLSRSERAKNLKSFEQQLGTAPLPISAAKGEGLDDLWTLIARLSRDR